MQFSKRAVIVTFTVCGTAGWTLLLFETLGGWHSGRETVILKHARQMAKCHVTLVSSGLLYFTQALFRLQVNRALLKQTVVEREKKKTFSRTQLGLAEMWICNYRRQTFKWLTHGQNVWIYSKQVWMFYEYSLYKYASICLGLTAFSAYIPHARCHFNTRKTLLCHFKKHANFSNDLHTCFMICKLYIFGFWTVSLSFALQLSAL